MRTLSKTCIVCETVCNPAVLPTPSLWHSKVTSKTLKQQKFAPSLDMYEQSINHKSLSNLLRRSDYVGIASALKPAHADTLANAALSLAKIGFIAYPLKSWLLHKKPHFAPINSATELLLRNVSVNLRSLLLRRSQGRNSIISNLRHFISEGVPYRIYRLDVKSFYESFSSEFLSDVISKQVHLSPTTRKLCFQLIEHQKALGHIGVPRGLAASAIISELAIMEFDQIVSSRAEVFFFARFVDDIIILTSGEEDKKIFFEFLSKKLPSGLAFTEEIKKKKIEEFKFASEKDKPNKKIEFDYLGYSFTAQNTSTEKKKGGTRNISVSISSTKIARLKTRIIRAFLDYTKNKNERLLKDRIKLLTSNFSIYNPSSGLFNTAGIYFSYPHIDYPSQALTDLDNFLRQVVLSKSGRIFGKIGVTLNAKLRNSILSYSFARGFEKQIFCNFTGNRLKLLQECWKY